MLMFSFRGVNLTIHTLGIRGCLTSTISKQTQHAKMVNKSNANMGRFHHPWIPYKNNDNISLSKKQPKTTQWKASAEITRILRALQRCITGNALFKFHHQHPFFVSPVNRLVISIQIILKWLKPFECQPKISYNLRKIPIFVSKNLTLVCCLSAQFASHPFPPLTRKRSHVCLASPRRVGDAFGRDQVILQAYDGDQRGGPIDNSRIGLWWESTSTFQGVPKKHQINPKGWLIDTP